MAVSENAVVSLRNALQLRLLGDQGVAGLHGVAQGRGELGNDVGVGVGDVRQQLDVIDQGRQLGVHPLEVAVEGVEALADLVASSLEGVGERVQGVVELGGLDGAQQRVEVVEDPLDLDRAAWSASISSPALREVESASLGMFSSTYFSPNSVLGRIAAVTLPGIVPIWSGLMPSVRVAPSPSDSDLDDLAHDHAAHLDVGPLGQLEADRVGLERDVVEGGELLGEHGVDQPHAEDEQADEHDPEEAVVVRGTWSSQPANLTVVDEPQMAMDRNRSITLTATIEVRTARPTATPTPAGPPLAV